MKTLALLFSCLLLSVSARSQCLTDFTKLLPEPTSDYTLNYGSTFSMYDNYLAIGLPSHDSLGRVTGLVYVYEKALAGWNKIATLMPSDPVDALQFGLNVKMSLDYILVSTSNSGGGKVYLFKKPATGWYTQTELITFTYPNTNFFGVPWYMGLNEPVDISDDQHTIAITDIWYGYRDPFLSSLCLRVVTGLVEKDVPPSPRPYSLLVSLNNVCCTNLIRVILLIRTDVSGKFDFAKRHIEVFLQRTIRRNCSDSFRSFRVTERMSSS